MKKIISILICIGIVLSLAACGAGNKNNTAENSDSISNKVKNNLCNVKASFATMTMDDVLFERIAANRDMYSKDLVELYGMDEATRDNLLDKPEEWLAFCLSINIDNPSSENIIITGLQISGNDKDGFFIMKDFSNVVNEIPANSSSTIDPDVFLHNNEPSEAEAFNMIKNVSITVNYVLSSDFDAGTVTDANTYSVQVSK